MAYAVRLLGGEITTHGDIGSVSTRRCGAAGAVPGHRRNGPFTHAGQALWRWRPAAAFASSPGDGTPTEAVRCSSPYNAGFQLGSMGPSVVGGLRSVEKTPQVIRKALGDVLVVTVRRQYG